MARKHHDHKREDNRQFQFVQQVIIERMGIDETVDEYLTAAGA